VKKSSINKKHTVCKLERNRLPYPQPTDVDALPYYPKTKDIKKYTENSIE
jgi:hypothetical protein